MSGADVLTANLATIRAAREAAALGQPCEVWKPVVGKPGFASARVQAGDAPVPVRRESRRSRLAAWLALSPAERQARLDQPY